jgi:hypothetical protein
MKGFVRGGNEAQAPHSTQKHNSVEYPTVMKVARTYVKDAGISELGVRVILP